MALYAHALIELADGTRYDRGDSVQADALDGDDLNHYLEGGALSEEPYDPAVDVSPAPDKVVIDGVTYLKQENDDA